MSMISRSWVFLAAFGLVCAFAPWAYGADPAPNGCGSANQEIFYAPRIRSEGLLPPGFADSLWMQLADPVRELGYCLIPAQDTRMGADSATHGENLFMQATAGNETGGAISISIAALRVRELARGKLPEAEARPLVYLRFQPGEAVGLYSVLAKKVAENLRNQYVAVLLIRSNPAGAAVRSASGLEGSTPVEWVVPLGNLDISLAKPGYLRARRDLDLESPGQHTYDLQLVKRRFYHSKLIYPTVAAGLISAAAFILENHYYGVYQSLGAEDRANRPGAFAENFRNAKNYERIGYAALGAASLGLVLCFAF
jgi:hypothetical protein